MPTRTIAYADSLYFEALCLGHGDAPLTWSSQMTTLREEAE